MATEAIGPRIISVACVGALCIVLGATVCAQADARDKDATHGKLTVATCQFPVSGDIAANGDWVHRQMREAADQGADIVHFPECALSGYAGKDHKTLDGLDWDSLRRETESILSLAKELGVWAIVGSTYRLSDGHKPHNALYVISAEGEIVDRYDKRFCTSGDLKHYSPGDHFVTFTVKGVKCGLLICYDIRFPELYRQYSKLGVQIVFHSFYNARMQADAIHPKIMPPTAQARAATNYMFVSMNNSCVEHAWPSRFLTPDGMIVGALPPNAPGVMINEVDTAHKYYDASRPYRRAAIDGKLNSGRVVDDPRSKDRTCY